MADEEAENGLVAAAYEGGWALVGPGAVNFALANEYLSYLADRRYSPRTVRAYAFDLLHWCRWLKADGTALDALTGPPGVDPPAVSVLTPLWKDEHSHEAPPT